MISFKNKLAKKEEAEIRSTLADLKDLFGDFYITKNNLRLFILDNLDILFDCLKKGDKVAFDEHGVAVILGYSDNAPRKYLKVLARDLKDVDGLLKVIYWNMKEDLYCKVKNNNPLKDQLLRSGFKFVGGRGKEILLKHSHIERPEPVNKNFSKDKDE